MLNITILAIGKIKETYFREAIEEYLKRLKPYAKIEVHELNPVPFGDSASKLKSKQIEGKRILNFLAKYPDSEVVILSEKGKRFTSVNFAKYLSGINRKIIFVIGGALGYEGDVLVKHKNQLSLSDMTFPHEMARVILAEQIYRAVTIMKDKEYHY